jgi:outer membrane protein assembly factor BamB
VLAVGALGLSAAALKADDWPQWLGPRRDGVWRETGILDKFPKDGPKVLWRTPVGYGYAGPAVADGRVFVTDFVPDPGAKMPASGFKNPPVPGRERVQCLEEKSGKVLWTHDYKCTYEVGYCGGPRATPTVHGDKVYTLGTMGDLRCLEATTGKLLWSKNFMTDYRAPIQQWGFSASPLVDGDKLICLVGGDAVAVAFDRNTGQELWKALKARGHGYCPPMIFQVGSKRQLIIWHGEAVNGLDPETGQVYWSQEFPTTKAVLTIPTPRLAGNLLFVTTFYEGPLMLKLDPDKLTAGVLWRGKSNSEQPNRTDGLHSIIPTPFIKDGYIYGVCSYGELRCLKADTGERVWEDLKATGSAKQGGDRWKNAFLIPHGEQGDRCFLFNEAGDLIIARLTPKGYQEISRMHILAPTNTMAGRPVAWMHPAFANRNVYARNDKEIVCVSLAAQ